MSQGKSKTKRIYLINRDFQMRYIRLALLVGLCSTLLTLGLILFPLFQFRIIRFPVFLPTPFLWAIGFAALINFIIVAFMGVLVTHRIAGPMFSMTRHMHLVEAGKKLTPVTVRAGDDLKYLVRGLNGFIDYLRRQTESDLALVDELLRQLQSAVPATSESLQTAEKLRTQLAERI